MKNCVSVIDNASCNFTDKKRCSEFLIKTEKVCVLINDRQADRRQIDESTHSHVSLCYRLFDNELKITVHAGRFD